MYLESKYTIWERRHLNENATKEKVLEILQNNKVELKQGHTPVELEEMIVQNDLIYDSQESMATFENHGEATIEFYDEEQKLIWNNQGHGG